MNEEQKCACGGSGCVACRGCLMQEGDCKAGDCPTHGALFEGQKKIIRDFNKTDVIDLAHHRAAKACPPPPVHTETTAQGELCDECQSMDDVWSMVAEEVPWVLDVRQRLPFLDPALADDLTEELAALINAVAHMQYERGRDAALDEYDIRPDR